MSSNKAAPKRASVTHRSPGESASSTRARSTGRSHVPPEEPPDDEDEDNPLLLQQADSIARVRLLDLAGGGPESAPSSTLTTTDPPPPPPSAVRMVQAKTEDGGWKAVPMYEAGMVVDYTNSGSTQTCEVLSAHLDDLMEPYYTVRLEDGREKQTDNAHISPRRSEEDVFPNSEGDTEGGGASPDPDDEKEATTEERPYFENRPGVAEKEKRVDPSAGNAPWYRRFLRS